MNKLSSQEKFGQTDGADSQAELAERAFADFRDSIVRFSSGIVGDVHLAQDVTQTVFTKYMEHSLTIDQASIRAWLFRVAYNESIQIRRRKAIDRRALKSLAEDVSEACHRQGDGLMLGEQLNQVKKAVANLPIQQQQVFHMRLVRELKFSEIANELNIPLGTALTRMKAALKRIRESIE